MREKGFWSTGTVRGNKFKKIDLQSEKELKKEEHGSFDYRIERSYNIFLLR